MTNNKKKTAQEVLADFRRNEILNAAVELIITQGRNSLTMERVAEQAGVAKGTVYLYFKDKKELIEGLLELLVKDFTATMINALKTEKGVSNKLYKLFTIAKEESRRYSELLILIHRTFGDIDKCNEEGTSKYEALYMAMLEMLEEEKQKGAIETEISNENIAHAFLSMLRGSVLIDTKQQAIEDGIIDERQIIEIFVRGIGAKQDLKSWY